MIKELHIVSFNIPYPPNYGGVMDVYYKIKSLYEAGVKVKLHCFEYGREESSELNKLCASVNYYHRSNSLRNFSGIKPYIVKTRKSDELLKNLSADESPILFEGLHTCYYLDNKELEGRMKAVRMHNVEWDYYRNLGKIEKGMFRKFYFYTESLKLKNFEKVLEKANLILPIAKTDFEYLDALYPQTYYLPAFHPNEKISCRPGRGYYVLYHGNLSVGENNQAALFIANKVFNDLDVPLIIAGNGPSDMLVDTARKNSRIELIINPREEEMMQLVQHAQINLLPTFQSTGIKLKLINALYNGRWVLVNKPMIENSGLESICVMADNAQDMKSSIKELMEMDFTNEEIAKREITLASEYSNHQNVLKLADWMFPESAQHSLRQ